MMQLKHELKLAALVYLTLVKQHLILISNKFNEYSEQEAHGP